MNRKNENSKNQQHLAKKYINIVRFVCNKFQFDILKWLLLPLHTKYVYKIAPHSPNVEIPP